MYSPSDRNLGSTFNLQNNYLDEDDPWSSILAATNFVVCSTYHTKLQATPVKLVFERDMIYVIPLSLHTGKLLGDINSN